MSATRAIFMAKQDGGTRLSGIGRTICITCTLHLHLAYGTIWLRVLNRISHESLLNAHYCAESRLRIQQ